MIIPTDLWRNPSYYVADFSASYKWKSWAGSGCTNFTNNSYFRRATGYPARNNPLGHKDILYYTRVCILKDRSHKIQNHLEIKH
jgi:hypothetical protein